MKRILLFSFVMSMTTTVWADLDWVDQAGGTIRRNNAIKDAKRNQGGIGAEQNAVPIMRIPSEAEYSTQVERAAREGDADAQVKLGAIYRGLKNEVEATNWFGAAAAQGHSKAQLFLGYRYLYGVGAPKNQAMANLWLRKAAGQGERQAQEELLHQSAVESEQAIHDALKAINESIKK